MLLQEHIDHLKQSVFFGMLPDEIIDHVIANAQVTTFEQGQTIYHQGDISKAVYCVAEGAVKLLVSRPNGLDIVVEIFQPGTSFAEALLFRDDAYPVSAVALTDSTVICVPKLGLEAELRAKPDTIPTLLSATYVHLHRLVRQIEHLKASSGQQRVADFILGLANHNARSDEIHIPYEKQTLASMLGMQPETLSRAFKRLTDHGVRVKGPVVELTDRSALETYVSQI